MTEIGRHLTDETSHLPYCTACRLTAEPYQTADGRYLSGCCDAVVHISTIIDEPMDEWAFEIWLEE